MRSYSHHFYERANISGINPARILSIDLETLVNGQNGFLTGERIIAVSMSLGHPDVRTEVLVATADSDYEEERILREFDDFVGESDPEIIIGYNHTGYDIPLLQLKMRNRSYSSQLWNLKYSLGTAYTMDMMYVIARDLQSAGEEYRIRKLRDAVNHKKYAELDLMRAKELVVSSEMGVGEAIKYLWENDPENFRKYCQGDTHDILKIFYHIFGISR